MHGCMDVCMHVCFYDFLCVLYHNGIPYSILPHCYLNPEKAWKVSQITSLSFQYIYPGIQAHGAAARIQPPWDPSKKPPLNYLNNNVFHRRFFSFQNPWARQLSWNSNVSAPAGKVHAACKTCCEGCLAPKSKCQKCHQTPSLYACWNHKFWAGAS